MKRRDRFCIKGKRDWGIFWVFTGLLCYVLGGRILPFKIQDWLFQSSNPYMTNLNDPSPGWGRLLVALVLMALVGEVVLLLCKRNKKGAVAMAVLLAAACITPFAVRGLYRVHTDFIVSSLWKEAPRFISIWFVGDTESGGNRYGLQNEDLSEQQRRELLEFCKNMSMISDEEECGKLEAWYRETPSALRGATEIFIGYDEKYGHSYSFKLHIYEGKIFIWRGNGRQPLEYVTFFEDAGLVRWLEELQNA